MKALKALTKHFEALQCENNLIVKLIQLLSEMHGAGRFEYRAKNYLREIKSSGKDSFIYLLRLCLTVFLRYHDAEKKLIAFCVCSLCHQKAC